MHPAPVAHASTPVLIEALDRRLRRLVAFNVRADPALIEDACQTAWLRLTRGGLSLDPAARLAWLVTTATREALRLVRCQRCEISLDTPDVCGLASSALGPDAILECRSRLTAVDALSERQRRVVWLQGLGFSYREIADHEDASVRTVQRQLLRARGRLRAVSDADADDRPD